MWAVEYYTRSSGRQPVAEWRDELDKSFKAVIDAKIVSLTEHGLDLLRTEMLVTIRGDDRDLYELRGGQCRIAVYFDRQRNIFVLLYGRVKKGRVAKQEIEQARRLLREYLSMRGGNEGRIVSVVRTPRQDLEQELQDLEYGKLYGAAQAKAEFAITVAQVRRKCGMTQKQLADKLGLSQPYIAKLEGGEANPTLGTVGSLLAVMGYRLVTDAKPLLSNVDSPCLECCPRVGADVKGE